MTGWNVDMCWVQCYCVENTEIFKFWTDHDLSILSALLHSVSQQFIYFPSHYNNDKRLVLFSLIENHY